MIKPPPKEEMALEMWRKRWKESCGLWGILSLETIFSLITWLLVRERGREEMGDGCRVGVSFSWSFRARWRGRGLLDRDLSLFCYTSHRIQLNSLIES